MVGSAVGVVAVATLTDYSAAWRQYRAKQGAKAYAMRERGIDWRHIAESLRLGNSDDAQKAAGMFLLENATMPETHGEAAGDAQQVPATLAAP